MKRFNIALVTGASSGIGEALCYRLAKEGIELIITGRDKGRLGALAEQLRAVVKVTVIALDLSREEDRKRLVAVIQEQAPDLVINNAGMGLYGDALDYATTEQLAVLQINGNVVLELTLEAARAMKTQSKRGVILNVSSVSAFTPFPSFAVYAAAKSFVNSFSLAFDEEMKEQGIRVLTACPGQVATQFRLRAAGGVERDQPSPAMVMSPGFAAEEIWGQIVHNQPLYVFNWKYRLGVFMMQYILPSAWLRSLLRRSIKKRIKNHD